MVVEGWGSNVHDGRGGDGGWLIDRGNIIMYIILTSRPRLLVVMGNVSQFRHFVKSYEICWYKLEYIFFALRLR